MARIVWTGPAFADLDAIYQYIRRDSPMYARKTSARIRQAAKQLKDFPRRGRVVVEYSREDVREILVGNYRIIYRIEDDTCYIIAVEHGSRDLSKRLRPDDLDLPN